MSGDYSHRTFVLRPVGNYFRLDWNYALRVVSVPSLRPASTIIAVMPIVEQIFPRLGIHYGNLWVLWTASVFFLAGYAILKLRAPAFIKEYQHYSQFKERGHSHRWILWQFVNARKYLSNWNDLLEESILKLLTYPTDQQNPPSVCCLSPIFPNSKQSTNRIDVFPLVNANRDIYLPMIIDGRKFVLPMQETDPCLENKQKELFWILLSGCAGARPISRAIVWFAFGVALILFAGSVLNNVLRATAGKSLYELIESIPWSALLRFCT
jgi:hypothetical protein